ncbi:hypothetical protein ACTXT7_014472 [Hymenolepis weldensis]
MNDSSALATYLIQYVGCIPVTISFKSLNFQERTQITRECIMRVCEDVGLRVPPARPISSNGLSKFIGRGTDLTWTRQSVRLIISVDGVTVQDFHSDQSFLPLTGISSIRLPFGMAKCPDNSKLKVKRVTVEYISAAAKTLKDTYANDVVNEKTCRRWFSAGGFKKDDFSLKDERRTESRMLKKLNSDQLQVGIVENPTCTTRELSKTFDISRHMTI